jgi:hypothetical protein
MNGDMAWLEIKLELGKLVKVLERIAEALDRAYPIRRTQDNQPAPLENLTEFDPEKQWEKEQELEARGMWAELPPQPK